MLSTRLAKRLCQATLGPAQQVVRWHGATIARSRSSHVCLAKDDDEDEATDPGKPLRVERLLANLGYGKRKECQQLVQRGRAVRRDGSRLKVGEKVLPGEILLDDEELDPAFPVVIMLHKPIGYVTTSPDDERITDPKVYDLLPFRFGLRRPFLSPVGRLDKATSGLLLLTDDGQLVHRINSPKRGIWKVYEATLDAPLEGKDAESAARRFASGALTLVGDLHPLLPAKLEMLGPNEARVSICEGRYHQVRRMFTAVGREVVALRRTSVGGLSLGDLPSSEWKYMSMSEAEVVFQGPSSDDVMGCVVAAGTTSAGSKEPASISNRTAAAGSVGAAAAKDTGQSNNDEEPEKEELHAAGGPTPKRIREDEKRRRRLQDMKKMVKNMPG